MSNKGRVWKTLLQISKSTLCALCCSHLLQAINWGKKTQSKICKLLHEILFILVYFRCMFFLKLDETASCASDLHIYNQQVTGKGSITTQYFHTHTVEVGKKVILLSQSLCHYTFSHLLFETEELPHWHSLTLEGSAAEHNQPKHLFSEYTVHTLGFNHRSDRGLATEHNTEIISLYECKITSILRH